jgi:hypothetical protein
MVSDVDPALEEGNVNRRGRANQNFDIADDFFVETRRFGGDFVFARGHLWKAVAGCFIGDCVLDETCLHVR